ncbi:condensation domain-containing protein, partial [Thauera sinica]
GTPNIQDIYPLAPLQEGMLFHHLVDPEHDAYVEAGLIAASSRERLDSLLAAIQRVIDRHDILRTGFIWKGLAQPMQVVLRRALLPIDIFEPDPASGDTVAEQLETRFDPQHFLMDITQPPMLRCVIADDPANQRCLLRLLSHHLAIDHPTLEMLVEEAFAIERGEESELPAPVPFRNFVAQARLGVSEEEHETFFRDMLGDIDEPTAPFDIVDVQVDASSIVEHRWTLDSALSAALRIQTRKQGVSPAAVMHLAWALVLARLTGRKDVVFGSVFLGRMQGGESADRALGMFMNTLPVRLRIGELAAMVSLRDTHALLAQLLRHEHAPLALAQRCSAVQAPAPLFTTILNYRHSEQSLAGAEGLFRGSEGISLLSSRERTNLPVCVDVDDLGDDFVFTFQVVSRIDPQRLGAFMAEALHALSSALSSGGGTSL